MYVLTSKVLSCFLLRGKETIKLLTESRAWKVDCTKMEGGRRRRRRGGPSHLSPPLLVSPLLVRTTKARWHLNLSVLCKKVCLVVSRTWSLKMVLSFAPPPLPSSFWPARWCQWASPRGSGPSPRRPTATTSTSTSTSSPGSPPRRSPSSGAIALQCTILEVQPAISHILLRHSKRKKSKF